MSIDRTSAGSKTTVPAIDDTLYTCPMHPEVQQNHHGNCSKRGMTLEPKTPRSGSVDQESAELRDMTMRFWIGAALTLPVFVLAMTHVIPALAGQSSVDSHAAGWMAGRVRRKGRPYQEAAGRIEACCDRRRRDAPELRLRHWECLAATEGDIEMELRI